MKKYFELSKYLVLIKDLIGRKYEISYSQSGEDLIIKNLFKLLKIDHPSYLDIGAYHPKNLNNTYIFYKSGSTGINVEPNKEMWEKFESQRTKDKNLNIGIGEKEGSLDYYVLNAPTLNTFSAEEAHEYEVKHGYKIIEKRKVEVKTVEQVINEHNNGLFPDFLSIDTEGLDLEILKSINWKKKGPKVICVETASFSNDRSSSKNKDVERYLNTVGYDVFADTYINTIFVDRNAF